VDNVQRGSEISTLGGATNLATGACFSGDDLQQLADARRAVSLASATVVYCVYENPFAKSGGIFAVADNYGAALKQAGRDVVILSPYHGSLKTAPSPDDVKKVGECEVPFGIRSTTVELFEHRRNGVRWILMRADGYFEATGGAGQTDPYVHDDPSRLLVDSLFASAAAPRAMAAWGQTENLIFHVQDWEFAATALTVKQALLDGILKSAVVVLTSHNPYDHELSATELRLFANRNWPESAQPVTVYQAMIPLTDAPLSTVSRTFAEELTSDPLQTRHFADHLQQTFKQQGVVGVNNGLFGKPGDAFSPAARQALAEGDPNPLINEKLSLRRKMLKALHAYQDDRIWGSLDGGGGRPLTELPDDVPVFMMFGRLDPGQKGFDVLCRAIEAMPPGTARFIMTPIVGGAPQPFIDDLAELTRSRSGDVAVYPFRMERGYLEAMAGATFAVMPSLYEPFGGATEPYLQGTPVVARGTGGLVQQVLDLDADPANATGILYRENRADDPGEWSTLETAGTPAARMQVPVYRGMVATLSAALTRACDLYRFDQPGYARLLSNLGAKAQTFSWQRAVEEYTAIYKSAVG
jgi:glycogen synthase